MKVLYREGRRKERREREVGRKEGTERRKQSFQPLVHSNGHMTKDEPGLSQELQLGVSSGR